RSRPLMHEIEQQFAASAGNVPPTGVSGISTAILSKASDIQSGEMLERKGMLDDALAVYLRCLTNCSAKLEKGQINTRVVDDRNTVVEKISSLALEFLFAGEFS